MIIPAVPAMGGGGSRHVEHHYHTEYKVPPETQQKLDEQAARLNAIEEEAMRKTDPKHYRENSAELMNNFVNELKSLTLTEGIEKKTGETHYGFIGQVSSGKTTLINTLYDLNLPTALGNCTEKCEVVYSKDLNIVWDIAGQNDDYKFYDPASLSFIKSLDKCIILFDNDISMISNILRVVHKINPNSMVIVRTKVDQHTAANVRTIEEEKKLDKEKIKQLLGIDMEVYCISSHNIQKGEGQKHDWEALKKVFF